MDGPPNQAVQCIPSGQSSVKIVTPPTGGGNTSSTTSGGAQSGTDTTKTSDSSQSSTSTSTSTTSQATSTFDPKGSVKPTDAQTVAEIKAYMDAHSISYTASDTKQQLLDKVNA